jgi:hypothetical protein
MLEELKFADAPEEHEEPVWYKKIPGTLDDIELGNFND